MEFSSYYYNNDYFNYYTITFINDTKGLFEVIINYRLNVFNYGRNDTENKFIISYDELVKSKNLYLTYIVSLILTIESRDITYTEQNYKIIGSGSWYIRTATNMYNKYIDYNYKNLLILDKYPTKITIDDIEKNDKDKKKYLEDFEDDGHFCFLVNNKLIDDLIQHHIYKLVNHFEYAINNIEQKVYSIEKYKLFLDNISKYKLMDDVKLLILAQVLQ
jgi:hypothetical protein